MRKNKFQNDTMGGLSKLNTNKNLSERKLTGIKNGSGWTTADYITSPHVNLSETVGKVHYSKKLKDGTTFQVVDRETSGMRGKQDKFKMQTVDKSGKVVKDYGSHPSISGGPAFVKNYLKETDNNRKIKSISERNTSNLIQSVKEGSGWTTADYITNAPHVNLSEIERIVTLLKLAKEGCLVDETKLTGKERSKKEIHPSSFMTIENVKKKYSKIKERYKIHESINERPTIDKLYSDEISKVTGARSKAVNDFIERNDLDDHNLFQFLIKGSIKDRMSFITALVGKPGNKYERALISKLKK